MASRNPSHLPQTTQEREEERMRVKLPSKEPIIGTSFYTSNFTDYYDWLAAVKHKGKCLKCGKRTKSLVGPICEKCNGKHHES